MDVPYCITVCWSVKRLDIQSIRTVRTYTQTKDTSNFASSSSPHVGSSPHGIPITNACCLLFDYIAVSLHPV